MTTIAVKDNVVAYDSLATRGSTKVNTPYNKRLDCNGFKFFFAGSVHKIETLVEMFFTGQEADKIDNTCAFVVSPDGDIYVAGFDNDGSVIYDMVEPGEIYAIGSGSEYAIGAMDAGCSARDAVKIAAARDIYTGGKIRTYEVK